MSLFDRHAEVVWIRERFAHMGKHSGYDQLSVALEEVLPAHHSVWLERIPASLFKRNVVELLAAHVYGTPFFSTINLWAEIRAFGYHFFSPKIIHVLYGENNLGLLARTRFKPRTKIVATLHQPLAWWENNGIEVKNFLRNVDALIVLSTAEKADFQSRLQQDVIFVPHGIDTRFFTPPDGQDKNGRLNREMFRCVFVGHWLRDFVTLKACIELITHQKKEIFFDLVVPEIPGKDPEEQARMIAIRGLPNVAWHRNIDDNQLKALYQNANILLLPLVESTANNAILEAMSCGLPIVTNATSGIADYTNASYAKVCKAKDAAAMAAAVLEIADKPDLQQAMALAARKAAVEIFDWSKIAGRVQDVYGSLA